MNKENFILLICLCLLVVGGMWLYESQPAWLNSITQSSPSPTLQQEDSRPDLGAWTQTTARDEELLAGDGVSTEAQVWDKKIVVAESSLDDFALAYAHAQRTNDLVKQFAILQELYEKEQTSRYLADLVTLAVRLRDYEQALEYIAQLEKAGLLTTHVEPEVLFTLLFNGLELNFKDIQRIKDFMHYYVEQGYLDKNQENLYSALITFTRGDMNNYSYFMEQLKGSAYHHRYMQFQADKKTAASFAEVPETYLEALTALHIFSQGYYQVALYASKHLTDEVHGYILPRQLATYSAFFLEKRGEVSVYIEELKKFDKQNTELYLFLSAIAQYHQGAYGDAIVSFNYVRDEQLAQDSLRYLLLAYKQIGDLDNMGRVMGKMLREVTLMPYDFFSIFDLFFYEPLRKNEDVILFAKHFQLATQYLDKCYEELERNFAYICLYGKSGLLLANGEEERAYSYLQRLVKWYQKPFLYEALGDIAFRREEYEDARDRFVKGLSVDHSGMQDSLKHKVRSSILQAR